MSKLKYVVMTADTIGDKAAPELQRRINNADRDGYSLGWVLGASPNSQLLVFRLRDSEGARREDPAEGRAALPGEVGDGTPEWGDQRVEEPEPGKIEVKTTRRWADGQKSRGGATPTKHDPFGDD